MISKLVKISVFLLTIANNNNVLPSQLPSTVFGSNGSWYGAAIAGGAIGTFVASKAYNRYRTNNDPVNLSQYAKGSAKGLAFIGTAYALTQTKSSSVYLAGTACLLGSLLTSLRINRKCFSHIIGIDTGLLAGLTTMICCPKFTLPIFSGLIISPAGYYCYKQVKSAYRFTKLMAEENKENAPECVVCWSTAFEIEDTNEMGVLRCCGYKKYICKTCFQQSGKCPDPSCRWPILQLGNPCNNPECQQQPQRLHYECHNCKKTPSITLFPSKVHKRLSTMKLTCKSNSHNAVA